MVIIVAAFFSVWHWGNRARGQAMTIRSCCDDDLAQEIEDKDAHIAALQGAPRTGRLVPLGFLGAGGFGHVSLAKTEGSRAKVAVKWVHKAMLQTHGMDSGLSTLQDLLDPTSEACKGPAPGENEAPARFSNHPL